MLCLSPCLDPIQFANASDVPVAALVYNTGNAIVTPIRAAWAPMPTLLVGLHEHWLEANMALLGKLPPAGDLLRGVDLCTYLRWDEVLPESL